MQLLINALIAGSFAALMAGGLSLVYGTLGAFNLALGQLALWSGYSTWWLHKVVGLPLFISIIGGVVSGGLLTWLVFEIFIKPFYKRHKYLPIITTIALAMILDGLILLLFKESPKTILSGAKNMVEIFGGRISTEQILMISLTIIALCIFAYVLHSTSLGRKIRAVVQHDHAATSLGIKSASLHRSIFIASGVLAAFGGVYTGIDTSLTPILAFGITIKAYAAVIAGGRGNFWGAIAFAYIIALAERLIVGINWPIIGYVSGGYQESAALLLLIVVLLWRPHGVFVPVSRKA